MQNAFATVGALAATVRLADAAAALLPKLVCSAPAAMVFVTVPRVELVTFAVIVQLPGAPAGMVPPVAYVTEFPPTTPDLVPVQVPPNVAFASVTPAGRVSTKRLATVLPTRIVGKSDCRDTGTTDTNAGQDERLVTVGALAAMIDALNAHPAPEFALPPLTPSVARHNRPGRRLGCLIHVTAAKHLRAIGPLRAQRDGPVVMNVLLAPAASPVARVHVAVSLVLVVVETTQATVRRWHHLVSAARQTTCLPAGCPSSWSLTVVAAPPLLVTVNV